jgi:hypothetical protein
MSWKTAGDAPAPQTGHIHDLFMRPYLKVSLGIAEDHTVA